MDLRDESLLQDLLDDRLDEAEAEAVRLRLESEPDLQEAWDDLARMREVLRDDTGVRAPRDFLTRVRQRIAVLPTETDGSTTSGPSHPGWQWTTTLSSIAALLLVAFSIRLIFLGDADSGPAPIENARVDPEPGEGLSESTGDALHVSPAEEKAGGYLSRPSPDHDAVEPMLVQPGPAGSSGGGPGQPQPATEAGSPRPVDSAPASPPRAPSRPRGFHPADAVPPGLREPSDEEVPVPAPPAPAVVSAPRREKSRSGAAAGRRARDPARDEPGGSGPLVYTLEAGALDEGRAELAQILLAVRSEMSGAGTARAVATAPAGAPASLKEKAWRKAPRLRLERSLEDASGPATKQEVLGSVVFELTPAEADRLAGLDETLARPPSSGAPAEPAPTTPAADPVPGKDAEDELEPQACSPVADDKSELRSKSAKSKRSVRVRVLIIKR